MDQQPNPGGPTSVACAVVAPNILHPRAVWEGIPACLNNVHVLVTLACVGVPSEEVLTAFSPFSDSCCAKVLKPTPGNH